MYCNVYNVMLCYAMQCNVCMHPKWEGQESRLKVLCTTADTLVFDFAWLCLAIWIWRQNVWKQCRVSLPTGHSSLAASANELCNCARGVSLHVVKVKVIWTHKRFLQGKELLVVSKRITWRSKNGKTHVLFPNKKNVDVLEHKHMLLARLIWYSTPEM